MACCTGQTNCNKIVTIGYLRNFTNGLIQDASGAVQEVNLNSLPSTARTDSYCPTYAQLTGGSLIPNFNDGGNNKWSKNVDGITVNGSYDSTQCVKQEDLRVTYTRFESLTTTATPSTNISECGGNSTMAYTYTLRKYVKAMNGDCEAITTSTTSIDTSDSGDAAVEYKSNQDWAIVTKPTVTLLKNGTHDAAARNAIITSTITFRDTQHSATATIGQKALTGDYKFLMHKSEIFTYDSVSVSPIHFNCDGGTWTATGYYTNHDWDVYRWEDSCGTAYDNDTVNRNDTYPTFSELVNSGSVSKIDCATLPSKYEHTEIINYHGKTASWTQECESCSGDCPCGETCRTETIHSGGTIPCTGGSVEILYDFLEKKVICNPSTGQRTETIISSGQNQHYATVYANECNKTNKPITLEYGVVQEAGPCCPTSITYTFADVKVSCSAHSQTTSGISWTSEKVEADGSITTSGGTYNKVILAIECNPSTSSRQIQERLTGSTLDAAQPLIVQEAGPCCCSCDSFTIGSNELVWEYNETSSKSNSFSAGTCILTSSVSATSSNSWFTPTVSGSNILVSPSGQNTTVTAKTATITVKYKNGSETCSGKTFTVTQKPYGCSCSDLKVEMTPETWNWNDTSSKNATYTLKQDCITIQSITSSNNWFNVDSSTSGVIAITPSGKNETTDNKTANITINYTSSGNTCSSAFTVTQKANACSCDDLTLRTTPSEWAWNETSAKTATYTIVSECVSSSITVSLSGSGSSLFTATNSLVGTNGTVTVTPKNKNTSVNAVSATVIVNYRLVNGNTCSATFDVRQGGNTCECSSLTIDTKPSAWNWNESNMKTATYTINQECVTSSISVSSNNAWFTAFNSSLVGTNGTVTVTPSGTNTSDDAKTATITINYTLVNGNTCSATFDVTQKANVCSCDDLSFTSEPSEWAWNETSAKTATYVINSDCMAISGVNTSNQWFSVSLTTGATSGTITVTPSGSTIDGETATITLTGRLNNGSVCSKYFIVKQNAAPECDCSNITFIV